MSTTEPGVIHHAVIFFDGDELVKEMLQVEFEAVLDQVVGLPEFAAREIGACYIRINQRLQILGAVFFLVDFDARGYVNRSWNVPLEHLLENAGRGPDLGAGRIRLACRSQCSIPWHARQLWDPILDGDSNSLRQMMRALQRNRLGLAVDVPEVTDAIGVPPTLQAVHGDSAQPGARKRAAAEAPQRSAEAERQLTERVTQRLQREYRTKLAAQKDEHELALAALKSAAQQQLDQSHQHYQIQLGQMKEALESAKKVVREEQRRNKTLKEKLAAQADEFQRAREQLQQASEHAQESGAQLQQQFEIELRARVEQARAELVEMLDMREVELFYREEQLGTLREEIARLRQEREQLIGQGGDRLLQHLVENGVAFVAYQPGLDAMTIPMMDIPRYLESPLNYVAEKCTVSPQQYQDWLSHHELPVCTHAAADGAICGELIDKIERPSQFLCGHSDRCAEHRSGGEPQTSPPLQQARRH